MRRLRGGDSARVAGESLRRAAAPRQALAMAFLFGALGVVLPFLSRWLSVERGLNGAEIGVVLAFSQMGRVVTGPLIAFWADGVADRRWPLRLLGLGALAGYAAFFFLAHDFLTLLATGFCALTLANAASPLVEGAVLRATAQGRLPYGVARGFGSASFIFASVVGGLMVSRFGLSAVVAWVLTELALFTLTAWAGLKPDPAPHAGQSVDLSARVLAAKALLSRPRYLILIIACGLIQGSHAFYYGFSTLVWRGEGISADTVGLLWACGVAFEVGLFLSLPLIERRVRPEHLILIGGSGGVVRWFLLGLAPTGWVLWPIQAMHAFSFASAHVGAMRLLFRETPEAAAGLAQTLYAVTSGGLILGLSTLLSGALYDHVGAYGYWAMSLIGAAGTSLALALLAQGPRGATEPASALPQAREQPR